MILPVHDSSPHSIQALQVVVERIISDDILNEDFVEKGEQLGIQCFAIAGEGIRDCKLVERVYSAVMASVTSLMLSSALVGTTVMDSVSVRHSVADSFLNLYSIAQR